MINNNSTNLSFWSTFSKKVKKFIKRFQKKTIKYKKTAGDVPLGHDTPLLDWINSGKEEEEVLDVERLIEDATAEAGMKKKILKRI